MEDMPEDVERRSIGTPATRAGIPEKLVPAGFNLVLDRDWSGWHTEIGEIAEKIEIFLDLQCQGYSRYHIAASETQPSVDLCGKCLNVEPEHGINFLQILVGHAIWTMDCCYALLPATVLSQRFPSVIWERISTPRQTRLLTRGFRSSITRHLHRHTPFWWCPVRAAAQKMNSRSESALIMLALLTKTSLTITRLLLRP